MLWLLSACTTQLNVVTSMPEAEIGVLRSASQPPTDDPAAEVRGTGELHERVNYSVFDTWWVWARAPGGEVHVQRYPTEVAAGPAVSCAAGVLLLIPLVGCFWVSKPVSRELHIDVSAPVPDPVPEPALVIPAPAPAPVPAPGCTKDTDCKGERICEAGACVDPS